MPMNKEKQQQMATHSTLASKTRKAIKNVYIKTDIYNLISYPESYLDVGCYMNKQLKCLLCY